MKIPKAHSCRRELSGRYGTYHPTFSLVISRIISRSAVFVKRAHRILAISADFSESIRMFSVYFSSFPSISKKHGRYKAVSAMPFLMKISSGSAASDRRVMNSHNGRGCRRSTQFSKNSGIQAIPHRACAEDTKSVFSSDCCAGWRKICKQISYKAVRRALCDVA